jgi:hypothetical protein
MNSELVEFARNALQRGIARGEIAQALSRAGWAEVDIRAALGSFADVDFALPVPKPRPYLSAREVFTYLVLFAALHATAYDVGWLSFEFIDRAFPDPLQDRPFRGSSTDSVRWYVASLIVVFPLFLFTFHTINKTVDRDPAKRGSRPRKWLTYLTLFVAAVTLVGDLIFLIYNALGGELTIRFLLKVLTVAIIAGGPFAYFFWDIRQDEKEKA